MPRVDLRVLLLGLLTLGIGSPALADSDASSAEAGDEDDESGEEGELEEVVQEVFLGSVAFPQEAKELQISVVSSWLRTEEADLLQPVLVGEWGFTDRLQLEIETPFLIAMPDEGDTAGGLGNAEVGLLYNVVRSAELGLVLSGGVVGTLPTASTDLIERAYGGGALLAAYKVIGPVHANLSVEAGVEASTDEDEGEAEAGVETALSLLVPLGSVIPVVEVGWEREEESELLLAGGLVWMAAEGIELGVAGIAARGEDETEWGAIANLTWERNLGGEID